MPLKFVLIDRAMLIAHGNLSEPLKELLLGLYQYGTAVLDIAGTSPLPDGVLEAGLLIADCDETLSWAAGRPLAVLGYEPDGRERRITASLPFVAEGFDEVDYYFLERVYQRFHGLPWTVAETERCVLREITLGDLDDLYELYRPPEMTRYMDGLFADREKEEEYTKAYIENMYYFYGYGLWVVMEKETGRLIGRAGLEQRKEGDETLLEMGYCIAVDRQRMGYATEVCREILHFAEEFLDFDRIYCFIQKENAVSVHLAEKLGFHWEKSVLLDGKKMQSYMKILQKREKPLII